MKKILSVLAILTFSVGVFAQNSASNLGGVVNQPYPMIDSLTFVGTTPYGAYNYTSYSTKDTVRFARQLWLGTRISQTTPVGSFHVTIHKDSSGTINAAKAYLEGSDDGINWYRYNDTLSCTNITTNFHDWVLPTPNKSAGGGATTSDYKDNTYAFLPLLYYRVLFVGVSTSKADVKAYFIPRR